MKTIYIILIVLLAGVVTYLLLKPGPKPATIIKTEYRDSPIVDSLKKKSDSIQIKVVEKKQVLYKYITLVKDSIVRDSIFILTDDVLLSQDSIITLKDSIISQLTGELKLYHDSVYYYRIAYIDEKTKVRKWRRISIASLFLSGILLIK
jgi:hypothetical protein